MIKIGVNNIYIHIYKCISIYIYSIIISYIIYLFNIVFNIRKSEKSKMINRKKCILILRIFSGYIILIVHISKLLNVMQNAIFFTQKLDQFLK